MAERPTRATSDEAGGRVARGTARALVALRWPIVLLWVGLVLASLFVLDPLESESSGSNLSGLVPDDTPAVANELRDVEIFTFPLSGRTAVVQRDPDGLSVYDQARTAVAAAAVTRNTYPGLEDVEGDLGADRPAARRSGPDERVAQHVVDQHADGARRQGRAPARHAQPRAVKGRPQ